MSLRQKLLLLLVAPIAACTLTAISISAYNISQNGQDGLVEKSEAILSRMEAVRGYVAKEVALDQTIREVVAQYPDGNLPPATRDRLMAQVPIIASWRVGQENAERDNYRFRVVSPAPRNPQNTPTELEKEFLRQFEQNPEQTLVHVNQSTNEIWVMRAVRLRASEGCMACHGDPADSPYGNGLDVLGYPMENMPDGHLRGMFMIISDLEPIDRQARASVLNIGLWGLAIGALALWLGIVVVRGISEAVGSLTEISGEIAQGKLDRRLAIDRTDELGHLGQLVNQMSGSLNNVLLNVAESVHNLNNASEEITASANSISNGAQSQAVQYEQLASSVQMTSDGAQKANAETQRTVRDANEAEQSMDKVVSAMNEIDSSSKRIGKAITIISEIAFKTNLLALNAAVEAARAGEQGRGFAVVANEVKKLAEGSQAAAQEIKTVIEQSLKHIGQGVAVTAEAGRKIKSVIASIQRTSAELEAIAAAAREQSLGTQKSAGITTQNAAAAEQMAASAAALDEQAKDLELLIGGFVLDKGQGD